MKFFKSTGVFAILVVILICYVYIFEFKGKKEQDKKKAEASKIFNLKPDDITGISFKTDKVDMELVKSADAKWQLVRPVTDGGDKTAIENVLKTMLEEKSDSTAAEGDSINLSYFGLDKPPGEITLKTKDNKTVSIHMGSVAGISGKKYIQLVTSGVPDKKVLMVGSMWTVYMTKQIKDMRDKSIFKISKDQIAEVKVLSKEGNLDFSRNENTWRMNGDYAKETDQKEVGNMIQDIAQMNALDVVSEDKSKFKFDLDIKKIELKTLDGKSIAAQVYQNGGKVDKKNSKFYLTLKDKNVVYEIFQRYWDSLSRGQNDFRDRNLPFEFDQSKVSQIEYKTDLVKLSIKKDASEWKSTSDPVDSDKVRELLGQLSNLKVQKFYGKNAGLFLHPKGTIILKDESGTALFNFQWGNDDDHNKVTVVKTNKINELLGVGSGAISKLPAQTLIKRESATK